MRRLSSVLLGLLSCRPSAPEWKDQPYQSPEVPAWSAWDGTYTWTIEGTGADEPGCALVFRFEGRPSDKLCDDCEYAFDLDFTWDEDQSINTWDCLDADQGQFTWTFGYDADLYGYDITELWFYHDYGAYWTPQFQAERDGDTLSFYGTYSYSAYYYDYYVITEAASGTLSE